MYPRQLAVTIVMLLLSGQAAAQDAAQDAARCAETRRNIARLEDNLRRGPPASDRIAFEQSLAVYRKVEPVYCGSGPSASGSSGASRPGSNPRGPDAPAILGALAGALQGVPLDAAAYMPTPSGNALPSPPAPTGSVTAPMALQRLGGPAVIAPTVNAPAVRTLEPSASSPFPSDEQIGASCSSTRNPAMCDLLLKNQRNTDPAYIRYKAEESARMNRNIDSALANVDAAIAARSPQTARPTVTAPVIATARPTIPVAPPPMPYDNSDPDLARCREGEKAPWTIAGCYDLGKGPPAAQAVPRPSLRDRLKKALDALPDTRPGPAREADAEPQYDRQWQPAAEARLNDAIRNGMAVASENRLARAACSGAWVYDGFSEGECYEHPSRVVYAVNVPLQTRAQAQPAEGQPREAERFTMDPEETEREIRRLHRELEPEQYGPPVPGSDPR